MEDDTNKRPSEGEHSDAPDRKKVAAQSAVVAEDESGGAEVERQERSDSSGQPADESAQVSNDAGKSGRAESATWDLDALLKEFGFPCDGKGAHVKPTKPKSVFLSHRGGQEESLKELAGSIRHVVGHLNEDIDIFLDHISLASGRNKDRDAQKAIFCRLYHCDLFVIIVSEAFFESEYCVAELEAAIRCGKERKLTMMPLLQMDSLSRLKQPPGCKLKTEDFERLKKVLGQDTYFTFNKPARGGFCLPYTAINIGLFFSEHQKIVSFDSISQILHRQHGVLNEMEKLIVQWWKYLNPPAFVQSRRGMNDARQDDSGAPTIFLHIRVEAPMCSFESALLGETLDDQTSIPKNTSIDFLINPRSYSGDFRRAVAVALIATGWGFEKSDSDDKENGTAVPFCQDFVREIAESDQKPQVAIVYLKYGARRCAEELKNAGIKRVLWIEARDLDQRFFTDFRPKDFVEMAEYMCNLNCLYSDQILAWNDILPRRRELEDLERGIFPQNASFSRIDISKWKQKAEPGKRGDLFCVGTDVRSLLANKDIVKAGYRVCDQKEPKKLAEKVMSCDRGLVVLKSKGDISDQSRCQAVALRTCARFLKWQHNPLTHLFRITKIGELRGELGALSPAKTPNLGKALLWFDLANLKKRRGKNVEQLASELVDALEDLKDKYADGCDQPRILLNGSNTIIKEFCEGFENKQEELILGEECGNGDGEGGGSGGGDGGDGEGGECCELLASDLHTDLEIRFKRAESKPDEPVAWYDLAEQLRPSLLEAIESSLALSANSLQGVYSNSSRLSNFFPLRLTSGVAFVNYLRDVLLGESSTAEKVKVALNKALRPEDQSENWPDAIAEVEIDLTHFARMYERSLQQLEQLTSHQKEQLRQGQSQCEGSNIRLHITAPAGAGKTFVGLHVAKRFLREEKTVLFLGQTEALCYFVYRWLETNLSASQLQGTLPERLSFVAIQEGGKQFSGPSQIVKQDEMLKLQKNERIVSEEIYHLVIIDEAHQL